MTLLNYMVSFSHHDSGQHILTNGTLTFRGFNTLHRKGTRELGCDGSETLHGDVEVTVLHRYSSKEGIKRARQEVSNGFGNGTPPGSYK